MHRLSLALVSLILGAWVAPSLALDNGSAAVPTQLTTPLEQRDLLPTPPPGKTWKLIWGDEFNGQALDSTKWTHRPDGKRKEGWWSSKAVSLDGKGHLVITTTRSGDRCVDGNITTCGKFEHAFGYYVCRVKFQTQPGHWPAFWLTAPGVMHVGDDGRDGTEIDIFEKRYLGNGLETNLHWDGYGQNHVHAGCKKNIPGLSDGWHTTAMWWKPDEYVFYVDGRETWRTSAGGVSAVPEYIILSDEVSRWAGDVSKAKLPDSFSVDYVRVYDLVDPGKTQPTAMAQAVAQTIGQRR